MASIDFKSEALAMQVQLIAWRRDFHRHPELGFQEVRTSGIVAKHLSALGIEVQSGIGKTGVIGVLDGARPGPVVMLRFDMDALPIHEENQTDYVSRNPGVMHACGHDAHTAIGMGIARLLSRQRERLNGTVKFVFQPAEEGCGGALAMIEDGALEGPRPEVALGLHVWNETPIGQAEIGAGPVLAAAGIFKIVVHGKGGHAAMPHQAVDAVLAGSAIVNALQTIVARNVEPRQTAVVTVSAFHAGDAFNVIADRAELTGTLRAFDDATYKLLIRRIREVAEGAAQALGATVALDIRTLTPVTINAADAAQFVRTTAGAVLGAGNVKPDQFTMAGEDMGEFLKRVPGCFFFLGSRNDAKGFTAPHHSPRFDIDEDVLPLGVAILAEATARYLAGA
ncbi:MAG TPA: amidohydrolase [Anaerolineae bacterium]|nr:amidohydrolase [Anaerolineae bacterium]